MNTKQTLWKSKQFSATLYRLQRRMESSMLRKSNLAVGLVFAAILAIVGCRGNSPTPTPTLVPPVLPSRTETRIVPTATWVIPPPSTPSSTATRHFATETPTVPPFPTPSSTITRVSPSPVPTLPPLTRAASAESARATTAAVLEPTLAAFSRQTPARELNSFELIESAWIRDEIDLDHAAIFKVYALFGVRNEIPAKFISRVPVAGDGTGLFLDSLKYWDKLNTATQYTINDFIAPKEFTPLPPGAHPQANPTLQMLRGTYITTITDQGNLKNALPLVGQWEWILTDRRGTMTLNGKLVVTQSFRVNGDQIIFADQFGSYACQEIKQEGIYKLTVGNQTLTLTRIEDPCDVRAKILESPIWDKQ
ncbi:hypothetical protein MTYM_01669 [Methylococcales bacterium]|nr:hypothetical protein MTYM_01669 [Methylococcales bacterium]